MTPEGRDDIAQLVHWRNLTSLDGLVPQSWYPSPTEDQLHLGRGILEKGLCLLKGSRAAMIQKYAYRYYNPKKYQYPLMVFMRACRRRSRGGIVLCNMQQDLLNAVGHRFSLHQRSMDAMTSKGAPALFLDGVEWRYYKDEISFTRENAEKAGAITLHPPIMSDRKDTKQMSLAQLHSLIDLALEIQKTYTPDNPLC